MRGIPGVRQCRLRAAAITHPERAVRNTRRPASIRRIWAVPGRRPGLVGFRQGDFLGYDGVNSRADIRSQVTLPRLPGVLKLDCGKICRISNFIKRQPLCLAGFAGRFRQPRRQLLMIESHCSYAECSIDEDKLPRTACSVIAVPKMLAAAEPMRLQAELPDWLTDQRLIGLLPESILPLLCRRGKIGFSGSGFFG